MKCIKSLLMLAMIFIVGIGCLKVENKIYISPDNIGKVESNITLNNYNESFIQAMRLQAISITPTPFEGSFNSENTSINSCIYFNDANKININDIIKITTETPENSGKIIKVEFNLETLQGMIKMFTGANFDDMQVDDSMDDATKEMIEDQKKQILNMLKDFEYSLKLVAPGEILKAENCESFKGNEVSVFTVKGEQLIEKELNIAKSYTIICKPSTEDDMKRAEVLKKEYEEAKKKYEESKKAKADAEDDDWED